MQDVMELIKIQIENNTVVLYMKGTPEFPMCGFSAKVSTVLMNMKTKFAYVNVLDNPEIRANLPKYANWPTFPQLYVKNELIGGCDIVMEMVENGELLPLLKSANCIKDNGYEVAEA